MAKKQAKEGTIRCACGDEVPIEKAIFVTSTGYPNPKGSCEACFHRSFKESEDRPHTRWYGSLRKESKG